MVSGAVRNRFSLWPDWPDTLVPRAMNSITDVTKRPMCACLIEGFFLATEPSRWHVRKQMSDFRVSIKPDTGRYRTEILHRSIRAA